MFSTKPFFFILNTNYYTCLFFHNALKCNKYLLTSVQAQHKKKLINHSIEIFSSMAISYTEQGRGKVDLMMKISSWTPGLGPAASQMWSIWQKGKESMNKKQK
jgi:hypothetical protein